MITIIIFLLAGLLVPVCLSARTVKGKVTGENGQALPFANVILLSLPDSVFVDGTVSAEDGTFTLETTSENQIVKISSVGYRSVCKPVSPADIGIIQLYADTQMLGDAVVKADLPVTRIKGDGMITEVAGTALEKAGTAEQMLDKIPNVTSRDGEIKVFGRGTPEIYVNGRKLIDNSELDRLSAGNIKSVEVVSNPGARYGSEVTSVIRIIMKKGEGEGFGLDNRTMFQYNRDWSALEQLDFNYRKNGWDLSGMLHGARMYGWISKEVLLDTYPDEHWQQRSDTFNDWKSCDLNSQLAVNYTWNDNSAFGVRYDCRYTPYSRSLIQTGTDVYRDGIFSENTSGSPEITGNGSGYHQVNAYYNGMIGGWTADLNLDGYWGSSDKANYLTERTEYADGSEEERYVSVFNDIKNTLYAARLILSRHIWGGELSFGGEYTYTDRRNINLNPEGIVSDDDSRINENMGAAFVEYSRKFGRVQAMAGLRYEYNTSAYYEKDILVDEQSKNYSNLFPTISIAFPAGPVNLHLAYRTDIARPSYWNLRSSILIVNKYTYETGNPLLDPVFTHNLSLGASYRWAQLYLGYNHIMNDILNVTSMYEGNPTVTLMSLANAGAYDKVFASLALSPTIGFWQPQWRFQLDKQWFTAETPQGRLSLGNPLGTIIWNNCLNLPYGFTVNADFMFMSKGDITNGRFLKPAWRMDLAVQKSFMNDNLNIRLDATNIFDSYGRDFMMYLSSMHAMRMTEKPDGCTVRLTVRYKFNPAKSKYKGTGAGTSQRNRM